MATVAELLEKALACHTAGNQGQAESLYRQILQADPRNVDVLNNLGVALKVRGQPADAIQCFRQALNVNPRHAGALLNLGNALMEQGKAAAAMENYRQALRVNPESAGAHYNLGNALKDQDRPTEAAACYHEALRVSPNHAQAHNNLGNVLKEQGQIAEALACFRRAVQIRPDHVQADSNVLNTIHFCPDYDAAAIYEECLAWSRRHAEPLAPLIRPHANEAAPERRLRIGYISPYFRDHCQALFTVPLFSAHDHKNFQICCYADVRAPDEAATRRLQTHADHWRNIAGLTDEQVADLVRQDGIDILVDLTMHMAQSRLLVFARKPAPVQVCWLAYPGTTGLSTIDYRFTDPYLDPPGQDVSHYSEASVRLPDSFWCYDPLTSEPPVNPLPAHANKHVTFGCFNNFCKVNEPTLGIWARVLTATASSRLMLLAPAGRARDFTVSTLQREGIAPDRLTFVSRQPRRPYLDLYHQVDIGLDTLPYSGHTTSLDAYWMGVPVVTLAGRTIVGRAGVSQLHNLGLEELIAESPDELVTIVVNLAGDLPRLGLLRSTLRQRLQGSPLMDARRFALNVEAAYRDMWRRWCARRHGLLTM